MSQGAAKRRRSQWANGHKHMAPMRRPRYKNTSAAKQAKRLAQLIEKQKAMQGRGKR